MNTSENDLLFDDATVIATSIGVAYLTGSAENLSPECNCSGYIAIEDEDSDPA